MIVAFPRRWGMSGRPAASFFQPSVAGANLSPMDIPSPIVPKVTVSLSMDPVTGKMEAQHPEDLVLTAKMLAGALNMVTDRMVASRARRSKPPVEVAGAAAMHALPPVNGKE